MEKALRFVKNNKFLTILAAIYGVLMMTQSRVGIQGIQNSAYYLKEMLMIMPVIFILTALLDTWVPKASIIKLLGRESKLKGVFLSFLLGSISAGPIYAAFPLCSMLLRKGASVKNIVIILSSWAVVKIPMLLNEAKFLGARFMAIRWVLTVLAIMIFAWWVEKLIKSDDLPIAEEEEGLLDRGQEKVCTGCVVCSKECPLRASREH